VVDNTVIRRRPSSSHKSKLETRRRLQHLCLDKAYHSEPEEQELNKRGYVLHIPQKRKRGEKEKYNIKNETQPYFNRKKYAAKRWVVERELTLGITGSGNYLHDMKKRLRIILG
jgi:hypothetical protein